MPREHDLSLDYIIQLPDVQRYGNAAIGIGEHGTLVVLAQVNGSNAIYRSNGTQFGGLRNMSGSPIYVEPSSTLIRSGDTERSITDVVAGLLDAQTLLAQCAPSRANWGKGVGLGVLMQAGLALGVFASHAPQPLESFGQLAGFGTAVAVLYEMVRAQFKQPSETQASRQLNALRTEVYDVSRQLLAIGEQQGVVPDGYLRTIPQSTPHGSRQSRAASLPFPQSYS